MRLVKKRNIYLNMSNCMIDRYTNKFNSKVFENTQTTYNVNNFYGHFPL